MEEDSKKMAEAGSFGLRLHFHARRPITGTEMGKVLGKALIKSARPLTKSGFLLGHLKAVAKTNSGFVKVSVVDLTLGPEIDTDMPDKEIWDGVLNIMAAVVGHTDKEIGAAVESVVAALSKNFGLEIERKEEGTTRFMELG